MSSETIQVGPRNTPRRPATRSATRWLLGRLYTHNPFYVISAALVLYGIHRAYGGPGMEQHAWLLLGILCGYTSALSLAAVIVVRIGRVWEDARMMLLLIVLMFVAISMSFDLICLQDTTVGSQLLGAGFLFSLLLTETVPRLLGLRLAWRYRLPFYAQLALLFGYPILLGDLSQQGDATAMSRMVLLFPVLAGMSLLMLWPAAHLERENTEPNGSPWPRGWYPWTMFFFVGLGFTLRSFSLTVTFEDSVGFASGYQGYFLLPLLFASAILFYEMSLQYDWRIVKNLALLAPIAMLVFAFPPGAHNLAQARYQTLISAGGVPPAIALLGAACLFYGWAWWRGSRLAERGLLFSLLGLAFLAPSGGTAAIQNTPYDAPLLLLAAIEFVYGHRRESTARVLLALSIVLTLSLRWFDGTIWNEYLSLVPMMLAFYAVMLVGLIYDDRVAHFIRQIAPQLLGMMALFLALLLPWLFRTEGFVIAGGITLGISTTLLYWFHHRRVRDMINFITATASAVLALTLHFMLGVSTGNWLQGEQWIAAGGASLLIGLSISLAKSGAGRMLPMALNRLHRRVHGRRSRGW